MARTLIRRRGLRSAAVAFAGLAILAVAGACRGIPAYMRDAHRSPEAELEACRRIRRELSASFDVRAVDRLFFFGTDLDAAKAESYHALPRLAESTLRPILEEQAPREPVRIFIFKNRPDYDAYIRWRYWWISWFVKTDGLYRPGERLILASSGMGNGGVCHELVHVLLHDNFEDPPAWLDEGMACLFECGGDADGVIDPTDNFRLDHLRAAILEERTIPLAELVVLGPVGFHLSQIDLTYAQSRYLCFYLHERKLLFDAFRRIRDGCLADPTGRAALEEVLGKTLPDFEREWKDWVLARPQPGFLGVTAADSDEVVALAGVNQDSPAMRAGLRAGDVLMSVNGVAVNSSAELARRLRAVGAGGTARIEYRRGGCSAMVEAVLIARPAGDAP